MTQLDALTQTSSSRPLAEDSAAFSLEALVRAELAGPRPTPAHDATHSGVVALEGLRGLRARPTHHLIDPRTLVAVEPAFRAHANRRWAPAAAAGALTSAVLSAVAFAWLSAAPTVAIEHSVRPAATLSLHHVESKVDTAQAFLQAEARVRSTPVRSTVTEPAEREAVQADEAATPPRASATTRSPSRTTSSTAKSAAKPATTPTPAKSSAPALTADCVLDPSRCMPETLTAAQLRTSLQRVEGNAKRCVAAHGMPADGRVRVQLSIAGATGRVTQATPQAPHGDALGRCVAAELAKATFPSFTRSSMGVVYAVTL